MNRAERRQEEQRAYARHQRSPVPLMWRGRYAGKTPGKLCSCEMCGNPRRHHGERTRQELRVMFETPAVLVHLAECDRIDGFYDLAFGYDCGGDLDCLCSYCVPDGETARHAPLRVPLVLIAA